MALFLKLRYLALVVAVVFLATAMTTINAQARPWYDRVVRAFEACAAFGMVGAKIGGLFGPQGCVAGALIGCGVGGLLAGWPE